MVRGFVFAACGLLTLGAVAKAFEVEATIKRVDAENRPKFFFARGMDRTATVETDAPILDANGKAASRGLKGAGLEQGTMVSLTIERQGNRPVIKAIRLTGRFAAVVPSKAVAAPEVDTSGLIPLTDLAGRN